MAGTGAGGSGGTLGSGGSVGAGGAAIGSGGSGGRASNDGGTGSGTGGSGGARDAGIGGSGTGGGPVGATFTQVKAILTSRCTRCHSSFGNYSTFTTHAVSRCGGDKLATPNDTANSAFLELVTGQGSCGGYKMPRGCSTSPCIPAAEIDTVTSWINAGALNN